MKATQTTNRENEMSHGQDHPFVGIQDYKCPICKSVFAACDCDHDPMDDEAMTITDDFGNRFDLSDRDIEALRAAQTAREADRAFDRMDCDVPPKCRAAVWQAV